MGIYANGNIGTVYVGTSEISDIYVGTNLVYTKLPEDQRPFYFKVADNSTTAKVGFERKSAAFHDYGSPTEPSIDYSKFSNYQNPVFQYSYDKYNWNTYTLGTEISIGSGANSNIVYFRGDNTKPWYDTYTTTTTATVDGTQKSYNHNYRVWVNAMTKFTNIEIGGNIMSLRYKSFTGKVSLPCAYAFFSLFYGCGYITSTTLVLPATTLTDYCYTNMFCKTSITTAPVLPATTMKSYCYANMFYNTNITKAPALPAKNLAISCYGTALIPDSETNKSTTGMFGSCNNLTTPPTLPATILAESCYAYMFDSCSKLTTPPALSATTLAPHCYNYMFESSGITSAPKLPATTLAENCYAYMFYFCSKLTTPPALSATALAPYCYHHMFDSSGITSAPTLPATNLKAYCYADMFSSCKNLKVPPSLPATSLADSCYYDMFSYCTALTKIPKLPATTMFDYCYSYMYSYSNVKANKTSISGCSNAFRIPTSGSGTASSKGFSDMFPLATNTEENFSPSLNTTFYISVPSF